MLGPDQVTDGDLFEPDDPDPSMYESPFDDIDFDDDLFDEEADVDDEED